MRDIPELSNPTIINSIDPLQLERYKEYLERRGCRLEDAGETYLYLLHLPDEATHTLFGPFKGYKALRIEFSDKGFLYIYTQESPLWNLLHIPDEAFLVDK